MAEYAPIFYLIILLLAGVGAILGLNWLRKKTELEAKDILTRAERESANLRKETELELKELRLQQELHAEQELAKARRDLHERERLLDKRQDQLESRRSHLRKQEKMVEVNQKKAADKIEETKKIRLDLETVLAEQKEKLQQMSGLSRGEAERRLLDQLDKELTEKQGEKLLAHEKQISAIAEAKAKEIIVTSIQRFAASHASEHTTNVVDIPSDDVKGRIIGREGRNIRTFEKATGCDVIIDDTPGAVIISGFDPVRREIGRLALVRLIEDGRIHPARIEEIVAETAAHIETVINKAGEEAALEADVPGLHPKVLNLLGRLKYRTSYSQNVLRHSVEVAFLAGMMAEEVGLDGALARRCGLLHDIGKAADHEAEGGHPQIGAEILKRHGENEAVVHAAAGHHDDIRIEHPYTVIVAASDACSASRPGARRESLERYIKRMEELERIAGSFDGVDHAFAIQAGREVRVMLSAEKTTDASAAKICHDIARRLENELTYPGEIKVTVLREVRQVDVAR